MDIFVQLSLIIVLVAVVSAIMSFLKQPLIIGYILVGILLIPLFIAHPESLETVETFSEMGIAILLFIVGLHLSPKEIKHFGTSALQVSTLQIVLTSTIGFGLAKLLGYNLLTSLYIAGALTFSSTIIVLKLLSDKKDLEKLYARIAIGVLLLQDIIAALALIVVAASSGGGLSMASFAGPLLKGILLTVGIFFVSAKILNKGGTFIAKSQEFLFLFSLGWGFGLATLFSYFGLSIEIGALVAGIALSMSPYSTEISARLKPLRDFFVVMFFVFIGSNISFEGIEKIWLPLIIFTLFILLGKPLIIVTSIGLTGHSKKTGFLGATTLAQISEFSLILALLGFKVGHIDKSTLSLITLLGIISFALSTYLIKYNEKIYPYLTKYLKYFEKRRVKKEYDILTSYDIILFGGGRVGYDFVETFKHLGQKFLCVDFDPDIVKELTTHGINCRYGDAEDGELLDDLGVEESKMIISTIPDREVNLFLLNKIKKETDIIVVLIAYDIEHALDLYEKGADYVILPHFIGGRMIAEMAEEVGFDEDDDLFKKEKQEHINYLIQRRDLGHIHPKT